MIGSGSRLRHVGIASYEIEKSVFFWSRVLGLEVFWDKIEPRPYIDTLLGFEVGELRTVKLRSDKNSLIVELLSFEHYETSSRLGIAEKLTAEGITHLAFSVDNLESTLELLGELGYSPVHEPVSPPDGSVAVVYVRGPDNVFLELVQDLRL